MLNMIKHTIRNTVKKLVVWNYYLQVKVLPVKKNVILFESNLGRNYSGNPRYIYEDMVQFGLDEKYQCIWFVENLDTKIPGKCTKVKRTRFRYLYYLAVAKVWVFDCRQPQFLIKRKEVSYIQTWHGTPLKKLALDMETVSMSDCANIEEYRSEFYANTRTWDYLISQNRFSTEVFKRCFAFDKTMLEIGYPRNDLLINSNRPEAVAKLKTKLHLPQDKKIILYAPTWRDNEFYGNSQYKFAPPFDYERFQKELGTDYVLIIKYHYLVREHINWDAYKGFIYQFDETVDIAELYLVSDLLITDYSSVMFDYSLLKRPMFFFAYDLDDYKNNLRGFYFDFTEEAPGPVSLTTEELIQDIQDYHEEEWMDKYAAFIAKYNHVDNGKASHRVSELIQNIVGE